MRLPIILAFCIASLAAADLSYAQITLPGGGEAVGWWDSDTRVLYKPGNAYTWIKDPKAVHSLAAPANEVRPAKRAFQRLPDLPYGVMKADNGQQFTGWFHEASGTFFFMPVDNALNCRTYSPGSAHIVQPMTPPSAMPNDARIFLDYWAVEHAVELDKLEQKKKSSTQP